MSKRLKYFNRDISWLGYDRLVLESALAEDVSIRETLSFISYHSSNLDEFYSVRVAEYHKAAHSDWKMEDDVQSPMAMLQYINSEVSKQMAEANNIITTHLCPRLLKEGICLHFGDIPTNPTHLEFMHSYFEREIIPNIQPVLLNKGTLVFLRDNRTYFIVKLHAKTRSGGLSKRADYSLVKLPIAELPRFVSLPDIHDGLKHIVFTDDIIRANFNELYPNYAIDGAWSIKICRDADLGLSDDFEGDIADEIRDNLVLRKTGAPAGFYRDIDMPTDVLNCLKKNFNFADSEMVTCGRYLNLQNLSKLPVDLPDSGLMSYGQVVPRRLQVCSSLFDVIESGDFMLHYPYQSFDYVVRLINEAAHDPLVSEIKITQYRVARNSAVVNSLIAAAKNNKQVTVFVELKARFDEKNNLEMSERMRAAGIRIVYSVFSLKVHAKTALIVRGAGDDDSKSVAYISTGNFNEQTARAYTDHGLFTADKEIISDLKKIFSMLENMPEDAAADTPIIPKLNLNKLLVSQINMTDVLTSLIDQEIKIAKKGGDAHITLKMNGIQYRPLIDKLYAASTAGVKIDLIVRGICCLVPEQSFSKNINLVRLVDYYLEHGRIWAFGPNGERGLYISSADWLNRNLCRRIEVATPVVNAAIRHEIMQILDIQLQDNTKLRRIDANLKNVPVESLPGKKIRAQRDIYNLIRQWK